MIEWYLNIVRNVKIQNDYCRNQRFDNKSTGTGWNSTFLQGIYLKCNPNTCYAAIADGEIVGVILTGHDGRRAIVHHMCVHEKCRRMGIASKLVSLAEEALKEEGIQKVFGLVFKDNDPANAFWEEQGYSLRTNLNYRNKSLNKDIPTGE